MGEGERAFLVSQQREAGGLQPFEQVGGLGRPDAFLQPRQADGVPMVGTEGVFVGQHAAASFVDVGLGQCALVDGF